MLLTVPIDVQKQIISYVQHKDIAALESTCSHTRGLVISMNCWQVFCETHPKCKMLASLRGPNYTWKQFYRQLLAAQGIASRRVLKEAVFMQREDVPGIQCSYDPFNLYMWTATLLGPEDTPYAGGVFMLNVDIPQDYPMSPPKCTFKTRIYHCNIDESGKISLDILSHYWSPAITIRTALISIRCLLSSPNPDAPLVPEIAQQYLTNLDAYEKTAREYVKKYASGTEENENGTPSAEAKTDTS